MRSSRVIKVQSRLVSERAAPRFLQLDNGLEFVSKAMTSWIKAQGLGTAVIDPGKPWQDEVRESFEPKFHDECVNAECVRSRMEAKVVIESWLRHDNEVRPHSSIDYRTPATFAADVTTTAFHDAAGRDAAVCGAYASRAAASPPGLGQWQQAGGDLWS